MLEGKGAVKTLPFGSKGGAKLDTTENYERLDLFPLRPSSGPEMILIISRTLFPYFEGCDFSSELKVTKTRAFKRFILIFFVIVYVEITCCFYSSLQVFLFEPSVFIKIGTNCRFWGGEFLF